MAQWRAWSRVVGPRAADSARHAMKPHRFALREGCAGGHVRRTGGMQRPGAAGLSALFYVVNTFLAPVLRT